MKNSRYLASLILAVIMAFTASALSLDSAEEASLQSDDLGDLVFSLDFDSLSSASSGTVVGKTTESYGSSNITLFNAGNTNMVFGIAKPSGASSNMLSTYVAEGGYHGHVRFTGLNLTAPGTYTLTYDVLVAAGVAYLEQDIGQAPDFETKVVSYPTVTQKTYSRTFESTASISFVQIQYARYLGGIPSVPLYIDNVKLYYKAPEKTGTAKIMFGSNDTDVLSTVADVKTGDAITMPTAATMAQYTPDGMYLKHFASGDNTVAAGASYTVTANDIAQEVFCFYPVFANLPDLGYGELVFFEDFEGLTGAISSGSYLDTLMMGTFASKKVQLYNRNAGSEYKIDSPITNGGKMLSISGGNYPQVALFNLNLSAAGTYTVMYDYYLAESTAISFMQSGFNNDNTRFDEIVKGDPTTVVLTKTLADGETINSVDIQTGFTNPAFYIDNVRIYYLANSAPTAIKANSIRTYGDNGVRFISFANKAVRKSASEYGYLVTVKDEAVSDYSTALVFADGERTENTPAVNASGIKYIYAANYIAGSKDIIYSESGDFLPDGLSMGDNGVYFTAVMINIPEKAYDTDIVVRPYVIIDGETYYGNVVTKSLYDAAKDMKTSTGYTENAFIESVINAVEAAE